MEDTTAEYAAGELLPTVPLLANCKVSIGAKTDLGRVRENNEDKFEFLIPSEPAVLATRGQVFIVCVNNFHRRKLRDTRLSEIWNTHDQS